MIAKILAIGGRVWRNGMPGRTSMASAASLASPCAGSLAVIVGRAHLAEHGCAKPQMKKTGEWEGRRTGGGQVTLYKTLGGGWKESEPVASRP